MTTMFKNKSIRSPFAPVKKSKTIEESFSELMQTISEINSLKDRMIAEVNKKLAEVNITIENAKKIQKGDTGPQGESVDQNEVIRRIRMMVKDGENPDPKYIISEVLKTITPMIPNEEVIIKNVTKRIPIPKADLKIIKQTIQENAPEVDPMAIIDAIMKLPKGKRFKIDHLDGWEQSISALYHQLSRGYLHGSGVPSLSAGSGITLTPKSDGGYTVSAPGAAGTKTVEQVTFIGTAGTLSHTPINTVELFRGGALQQSGAGNDYTISGKIITLLTATEGEVFLAIYNY